MRTQILTLAGIALLAGSCAKQTTVSKAAAPEEVQSVPVVRAARANLAGSVTLTGEFIPFQEVDVMSKVAGYAKSVNVDVGDRVRQGQVLATLEIPEMEDDLARAQAAIAQANAGIARAQDDVHRAQSAHEMTHLSLTRIQKVATGEPGLVPQQDVDEMHSRDLEAEAQLAGAQNALVEAQEHARVAHADEARVQTMHNYETITAPFDGVVTKRYANTGAMIQAGTASQSQAMPVVQVSQNGLLRLILPVPESSVSQVAIGETVEVRVPSLNRTFQGRVARVTDKLQLSTRTMDTEVDVPNPSLTLIPGMYAEVDLRLQEHRDVIAVPIDAVDGSGANARVFVVTSANRIHIIPVTVGLETAQQVEIREGLNEGDTVIVGRHAGLKESDPVRPVVAQYAEGK